MTSTGPAAPDPSTGDGHDPIADRDRWVASLGSGPRDPVTTTPARRPGSVRRTTAIDQLRADMGEPKVVVASARDLRTGADGAAEVLDEVRVRADVDAAGLVTAIAVEPADARLDALVGVHTGSGFRAAAARAVPEHAERATVLHQLLDDVPLAALIGNYGFTRDNPDWEIPPDATAGLVDLCAGWAAGGTMLTALGETGVFPVPIGPTAPPVDHGDDPWAWHDAGPMAPRSVRRTRRLDVWLVGPDGGGPTATAGAATLLGVDVHFRDAHQGLDGGPEVLHEYVLAATVDAATLVVRTVAVEARTLPWPECPGALASAQRIVGRRVDDLPGWVRAELAGTSTCTHLNDLLRSLAGVAALAPRVLGR